MSKDMPKTIILVLFLVLISGCKSKDSETSEDVDQNQVKKEWKEATEVTKEYFEKQKENIMNEAKLKYAELEKDTKQLISDIKNSGKSNWEKLNQELDYKLKEAQMHLDEIQKAGKESLQKAQEAFDVAAKELKDAYQKTKTEIETKD